MTRLRKALFSFCGILVSFGSGYGLYWLLTTGWAAANSGSWGVLFLALALLIVFGSALVSTFIAGLYLFYLGWSD